MFKVLVKTEFARNIFSLTSSSIIAQVINFFLTMVLYSHLFAFRFRFAYHLFYCYIACRGILHLQIRCGHSGLQNTRKDGISLVRLSMFISIIFSLFAFLVIVIFKPFIKGYLEHPEIINWFYYLPVTLFFTAVANTVDVECEGKEIQRSLHLTNYRNIFQRWLFHCSQMAWRHRADVRYHD